MKDSEKYLATCSYRMHNLFAGGNPDEMRHIARQMLERQMASFIAGSATEEKRQDYYTVYRLEVYAVPVDDFWRLVSQEAARYSLHSNLVKPMRFEDDTKPA